MIQEIGYLNDWAEVPEGIKNQQLSIVSPELSHKVKAMESRLLFILNIRKHLLIPVKQLYGKNSSHDDKYTKSRLLVHLI